MSAASAFFFLMLYFAASPGHAYKRYQFAIPNGDRVVHPCFPNKLWWGVGHHREAGGGPRNPFGRDFRLLGDRRWTRELCQRDSDGDGRTNGEELGDPECTWTAGGTLQRTFNITHPGVCEPITSDKCRRLNGDWKLCVADEFRCNATRAPDVVNVTLRYARTKVPARVTNYFCQAFRLPDDGEYHMIATRPLIDNANMMHHSLIFGCDSEPDAELFKKPRSCRMEASGCYAIIGLWGPGAVGECFPEQYGIPVGRRGYKFVVVQHHWNNPTLAPDQYDASGMTVHLTRRRRPNDGAVFTVGQRFLELPPGRTVVVQRGECSAACSRAQLTGPIYFTDVIAHMHYAGRRAEVAQFRNGSFLRYLLPLTEVRYDEPQRIRFQAPLDFRPGDSMRVTCEYRTVGKQWTAYYGDSTQDEMCYVFLGFYPKRPFHFCIGFGPVDQCALYSRTPGAGGGFGRPGRIGDCDLGDFLYEKLPRVWQPLVDEFCPVELHACRGECRDVARRLGAEPCWGGWPKRYIDYLSSWKTKEAEKLRKFRLALSVCERESAAARHPGATKFNACVKKCNNTP